MSSEPEPGSGAIFSMVGVLYAREGRTSADARAQVARMRAETAALRPADARQEILMGQTLDAINALVDARRERTGAVTSPVPPVEMSHPFSGPTGLGPDAFLAILARFDEFSQGEWR